MKPYHLSPEGILLLVKVIPKASRNKIEKVENGRVKIKVRVAPEKGKANDTVIDLLSESIGIAKSHIILIQGEKSPLKIFLFTEISILEFIKKFEELGIFL